MDPAKAKGWPDTYPPRNLADWGNYVQQTVWRYRDRIQYREVWNEENGIDFFHPAPDAELYVELLKTAYIAAKRANPYCRIVLGGLQMNGIIPNPWSPVKTPDFLADIYKAGGGPFFDVCNTHPYISPAEGGRSHD